MYVRVDFVASVKVIGESYEYKIKSKYLASGISTLSLSNQRINTGSSFSVRACVHSGLTCSHD